jgi:hypothetical protein
MTPMSARFGNLQRNSFQVSELVLIFLPSFLQGFCGSTEVLSTFCIVGRPTIGLTLCRCLVG